MITKRDIIRNTSRMKNLLSDVTQGQPNRSILLNSPEYAAIGCDLRNIPRLQGLLGSICDLEQCLVLCVAEVSVTYMYTDAADALIEWTSTLSNDVTFCLLEQGSPDRPDHPFTETMVKHFKKLGTPLHSLFEYPGYHAQSLRFQSAGFNHCETQNLWELWGDINFISPSERLALDEIEPFDEWEEFALFASHYLLVVAHNRPSNEIPERQKSRRDSVTSIASDFSVRTASPFRSDNNWFAVKYYEDTSEDTKRHHASAYQVPDQDAIGIHGGIGPRSRLACTSVCRARHLKGDPPVTIPSEVSARCCHTVTTLPNGQNILVGGRGSPTQPMKDCWVQTGSQWSRVHDLPEPRYRHRTVPVTLSDGFFGAVVFGGKTDASRVASTTLVWDPRTGWSALEVLHQTPVPRFGASFVYLGFNHGLLFGGMRRDGVICQGFWRWRLVIRNNKVVGISFRQSKALDASVGAYPWLSRLGASCGLVRDELLIIGGIARSGTIPKIYEILSILGSFSTFGEYEKEMQLRLTCVEPEFPPNCPRPFFIGHSTHRTKSGTLVFVGGGATCFSFGNYFNSGMWIMHQREEGLNADWVLVKTQPPKLAAPERKSPQALSLIKYSYTDVKPADISSTEDFLYYIRSSQPSVMRGLDLGPCLSRWSPRYLRDKVDPGRTVVIHNAPGRGMNFQRKDFAYKTLAFPDFISTLISASSHVYLRALSSANPTSTPANFEVDWPELSPDVLLPAYMSKVLNEKKHSSCLRISNDVTMWLHYDVMANVLFQIHGIKKLVLFPPSDIKYLAFPPGSTTSEIDIFRQPTVAKGKSSTEDVTSTDETCDTTQGTILVPEGSTPHVVILKPGDALFIPPLWAHSGISLEHEIMPNTVTKKPQAELAKSPENISSNTSADMEATPQDTTGSEAALFDHNDGPSTTTHKRPHENKYTNIAINVFFRSLPQAAYPAGRDVYGNRDLAPYEDARRDLDRIVRRFTNVSAASSSQQQHARAGNTLNETNITNGVDTGKPMVDIIDTIPDDITKAYLERLADELRRKADEL